MNEILSCDTTTWLHGRHPTLFKGKVRAIRICRETTRVLLDQHPDHNHTVNANDLLSSKIATADSRVLVTRNTLVRVRAVHTAHQSIPEMFREDKPRGRCRCNLPN